MLLAIDPGPDESAWVVYDTAARKPLVWKKAPNDDVRQAVLERAGLEEYELAIEMVASYGMAVGAEVFDTCVWVGRYAELWHSGRGKRSRLVYRRECKLHLCGSPRANDANIRQAIIDRYGPGKEKAIGKKTSPGPLFGMKADCWQALAVGITAAETPELSAAMLASS